MPVKFNVVEHINPSDPSAPKKYYPSLVATSRCDERQLAELIAAMSTMSTADMMAALEAMLVIVSDQLMKGNVVTLGEFGSFWLKVNAVGSDTPAKVSSKQIRTLVPHFRPGKEFKKRLEKVEFRKAKG